MRVSVRIRRAAAACLLLFAAGCTGPPGHPLLTPAGEQPPAPPDVDLPACSATVRTPADADTALANLAPGDTVCFVGTGLEHYDIELSTPGTERAPITLAANGTTVSSVVTRGDHVTVSGFLVSRGGGITVEGAGVRVRDNVVYLARDDGIACARCSDTTIESNVVRRADGAGIVVNGSDITVRGNRISGSTAFHAGDADGIRFFGHGHRLTHNTITNISARGYGSDPPHTDCFQTFDNDRPATYDVVIAANTCRNVSVQCLIATGDERGNRGAPAEGGTIVFRDNTCHVGGSQAVLLRHFAEVHIVGNTIAGARHHGVAATRHSTGTHIVGNTFLGDLQPYYVDESSRTGLVARDNTTR